MVGQICPWGNDIRQMCSRRIPGPADPKRRTFPDFSGLSWTLEAFFEHLSSTVHHRFLESRFRSRAALVGSSGASATGRLVGFRSARLSAAQSARARPFAPQPAGRAQTKPRSRATYHQYSRFSSGHRYFIRKKDPISHLKPFCGFRM